jgi:hypothetical protein
MEPTSVVVVYILLLDLDLPLYNFDRLQASLCEPTSRPKYGVIKKWERVYGVFGLQTIKA